MWKKSYDLALDIYRATLCVFLDIAAGSGSELDNLLMFARDLSYLHNDQYGALEFRLAEVKKMLIALILKVRKEHESNH
jgi:four helix bundle protein